MKGQKVVVFGGSGYVGGAVSHYLMDEYAVTVADIRPPSAEGVPLTKCDVREPRQVASVLKGASAALYFSIVQIPQINSEKRLGYEVNILGLQNVCETTLHSPTMKGLLLAGTWHVFGERGLNGTIDESFGFRPDKVEERARVYALSKVVQEGVVRFYDEMATRSGKVFGVIRMGTVLGIGMPEQTAANIFIKKGLNGEPLTPYRHSMHRPIFYVDIQDVCKGYSSYLHKILAGRASTGDGSLGHVVNLFWPRPITVIELAALIRDEITNQSKGRVRPGIEEVDEGLAELFAKDDSRMFRVDDAKAKGFLEMEQMVNPRDSIKSLVSYYMRTPPDSSSL